MLVHAVYKFENIKSVENTSLCFTISDQLLLDILLTEIRGKTISYSTYKKKKKMTEREISLGKEIQFLEQNLTDSMADILIEKQKELENIRKHKLRGQIVRARLKWIEEGETAFYIFLFFKSQKLYFEANTKNRKGEWNRY